MKIENFEWVDSGICLTLSEIQDERDRKNKATGQQPALAECVTLHVGVALHRAALEAVRDPKGLPTYGEPIPTAFCTPQPHRPVLAFYDGGWVRAKWLPDRDGGESSWSIEGERLMSKCDDDPEHWRPMLPPPPPVHWDYGKPDSGSLQ